MKLLTKRFGVLPQETKKGIEQLDKVTLEKITDGIFDFESLDDVKKHLK